MFNYRGGQNVKSGFYWNLAKWEIVTVEKGRGILPGGEEHRYIKLPILLMIGCAPVMGAIYVIFLPLMGFALILGLGGKKLVEVLHKAATEVKETVRRAHQRV